MTVQTIFLTGDTSVPEGARTALAAVILARATSRANKEGKTLELYTGDQPGFEQGVRSFAQALGLTVHVVVTNYDESGAPMWDERHVRVAQLVDRVLCANTDPYNASPVASSLQKTIPADRLRVYA